MPNTIQITAVLTVDGNPFRFGHEFDNLQPLLFDAAEQALLAKGGTSDAGDVTWNWDATQNVPFTLPISLPFGIHEKLAETLNLAEAVQIKTFRNLVAPALAYPVTRP